MFLLKIRPVLILTGFENLSGFAELLYKNLSVQNRLLCFDADNVNAASLVYSKFLFVIPIYLVHFQNLPRNIHQADAASFHVRISDQDKTIQIPEGDFCFGFNFTNGRDILKMQIKSSCAAFADGGEV